MVTTALSLSSTGCTKAETNKGVLSVLLNTQNTALAFGKQRKGNKRPGCFLFPSESRTLNKILYPGWLLSPQREDEVYEAYRVAFSTCCQHWCCSPLMSLFLPLCSFRPCPEAKLAPSGALWKSSDFRSPSRSESPHPLASQPSLQLLTLLGRLP